MFLSSDQGITIITTCVETCYGVTNTASIALVLITVLQRKRNYREMLIQKEKWQSTFNLNPQPCNHFGDKMAFQLFLTKMPSSALGYKLIEVQATYTKNNDRRRLAFFCRQYDSINWASIKLEVHRLSAESASSLAMAKRNRCLLSSSRFWFKPWPEPNPVISIEG